MLEHNQNTYIIFSAYKSDKGMAANVMANKALLEKFEANNVSYKELVGSYKGTKEISYIINASDLPVKLGGATYIFDTLGQESFIELLPCTKGAPMAHLHYADGTSEKLGLFREVSEIEAKACDAYTHDVNFNKYYLAN